MAGTRVTNQKAAVQQQQQLLQPLQHSTAAQVHLRCKSSQSSADRLSQSRSLVLHKSDLSPTPICHHRRNQSQHNVTVTGAALFGPLVKGEELNVAKICESGKKQRKNWTAMWTVLNSDQLLFYKDRPAESGLPLGVQKSGGKADVLQLCGSSIEWTKEKSSRKNVIQITTSTGSKYLLQADSYSTASKWYDAVRRVTESSTAGGFPFRRSNSTEYLSRHSSLPGYGSSSPSTKPHRRSINMFSSAKLKHSTSDSSDKNGVKNRLKKFITRRPSMKTLQDKGLIKDRVFGCHLSTLCEREGTTVPKFVQICLEEVNKRGLEVDGIYRVCGNLATIQKLRFIVDQEEDLDLHHSQWEDIHVITGALKMFFRELPEPLLPFRFFPSFVEAIKIRDSKHKIQAVKKLMEQLPKPNRDTMKLLFIHLHRVLDFSKKNLMSTQGIGIVFGPTLMWPELDAGNIAVNMAYQNQIVELVLVEARVIFDLDKI